MLTELSNLAVPTSNLLLHSNSCLFWAVERCWKLSITAVFKLGFAVESPEYLKKKKKIPELPFKSTISVFLEVKPMGLHFQASPAHCGASSHAWAQGPTLENWAQVGADCGRGPCWLCLLLAFYICAVGARHWIFSPLHPVLSSCKDALTIPGLRSM